MKLKTKKKENEQYALYCPKKDKWAIVFLSGFDDNLGGLGQHFHCGCGEIIEK